MIKRIVFWAVIANEIRGAIFVGAVLYKGPEYVTKLLEGIM
jgi:hypothetical protein